ncbi:dTMP kinase [Leptospira kanakyensis]|uniref:Thymidylate kinase n=1 Tax=Leptospira kanakyensis TaxID=2484968 RepID=A0A6N4QBY1_9LEPT|nr:dTMP kinase [Leptospira kanakyensis]MCW7470266.1 dTMP kinase [Leptospira kanakyensis]MCW7481357.1 dTMP kinase [Leptospira kanakyensis]TGK54088.1 dTMP kinase [Leptospira kanakyensis]TGK57883.1 dTMP kinase [Leptospira kanakyensis]TGK73592.1 dTMP kinase [Leptospira kanakyensis]
MPQNNQFFVFEGIDGSGKTTVSRLVSEALLKKSIPNLWHREPTDSVYGKKIREFLEGKIKLNKEEQIDIFIKDREVSVSEVILPTLKNGKSIVQDRYYFSTAAYQGRDEEHAADILYKNEDKGFPEPNRIYFLDLSPEEAHERRTTRGGTKEVFDVDSEQIRIYQNYLAILPESTIFVDATAELEEVVAFCVEDILKSIEG